MKRVLFLVVATAVALMVRADEKKPKPPKRAETPFTVFVDAHPKGEEDVVEAILECREELEKKLRKNKKWFRVSETADAAELVVDLELNRR